MDFFNPPLPANTVFSFQRLFEVLNIIRNQVLAAREGGVGLPKKMDFFSPTPFQPYRFELPTRVFKFLNLIPGRDVCRLECALHPDLGVMDQSGRALVR